jgi:hypothetical protein
VKKKKVERKRFKNIRLQNYMISKLLCTELLPEKWLSERVPTVTIFPSYRIAAVGKLLHSKIDACKIFLA